MTFECTYIIAYVVNLRSGDEIEGLESMAGILEVKCWREYLKLARRRKSEAVLWVFQWVFVLFGVLTFKRLDRSAPPFVLTC